MIKAQLSPLALMRWRDGPILLQPLEEIEEKKSTDGQENEVETGGSL